MIGSYRCVQNALPARLGTHLSARSLLRPCHCSRPFVAALTHASHPLVDRYQQPLSKLERNTERTESQRLGKQLVTVQIGRQGITPNLIIALGDALAKNELVKVWHPASHDSVRLCCPRRYCMVLSVALTPNGCSR